MRSIKTVMLSYATHLSLPARALPLAISQPAHSPRERSRSLVLLCGIQQAHSPRALLLSSSAPHLHSVILPLVVIDVTIDHHDESESTIPGTKCIYICYGIDLNISFKFQLKGAQIHDKHDGLFNDPSACLRGRYKDDGPPSKEGFKDDPEDSPPLSIWETMVL